MFPASDSISKAGPINGRAGYLTVLVLFFCPGRILLRKFLRYQRPSVFDCVSCIRKDPPSSMTPGMGTGPVDVMLTLLSLTGPTIPPFVRMSYAKRIVFSPGSLWTLGGLPAAETRLRRRSIDLARRRTNARERLMARRCCLSTAFCTTFRSKKNFFISNVTRNVPAILFRHQFSVDLARIARLLRFLLTQRMKIVTRISATAMQVCIDSQDLCRLIPFGSELAFCCKVQFANGKRPRIKTGQCC